MAIGALEDTTSITVYSSDGASQSYTLNKGGRLRPTVGSNGTEGRGNAYHIVADKPIAAVQVADSDGSEATAFWSPAVFAKRYALPVDAQYVAVSCLDSSTSVTLTNGANPPETQVCTSDGLTPGKLYFGSSTDGANISAGATLESTGNIYLMYEVAATNDEHNLLGNVAEAQQVVAGLVEPTKTMLAATEASQTQRAMVVVANSNASHGYTVWQNGPETDNTWMQTATDPNAYDRPKALVYLSEDHMKIWQNHNASNDGVWSISLGGVTFSVNGISQWLNDAAQGEYIKVNHGGTAPTAGPIDSETWTYTYDANGNVETIDSSNGSSIYGYDALDRLTGDEQPAQSADTLAYDRNGNRTSITDGVTGITSSYVPNSNQLDTLDGMSIGHDAAGNRTSDQGGNRTFEYNNAGRLFKVYEGGSLIATYTYNYQGQRTRKVTSSGTTVYHYDLNGSLISETDELGAPIKDIVYRGTVPVAQIDVGLTTESITYLHTDHLGTPRRGTDENGVVVWSWDSDAFGATAANDDPDADGVSTVVNLRFPGQYYDAETGLHYNYNRYYDPSVGRYITSDPTGIDGGINTFLYANANPLYWTDPLGLCPGYINTGWSTGRASYQTLPGGRQREYTQGRMRIEGTLISGGDCVSECGNSSGWTTCTYLATIYTMTRSRIDDLVNNVTGSWSGWSSPLPGRAQPLTIGYNCETGEWRTP